jgi:NAD-dependent dihydropyrimidine dehydrogenase PreA subunit
MRSLELNNSKKGGIMAVNVDTSKCTGSGECIDTCPVEALSLENGKAVVDEDECIDCGACVDACPNGALSL